MKKLFYLLSTLLIAWSCEKAIIDRPDPFAKPERVEIFLDFSYRESSSVSGFVAFTNLSRGFQSFQWDFGYKDAKGIAATSTDVRPYTFFPANGEYLVILKGLDVNGKQHAIHKYVVVVNR